MIEIFWVSSELEKREIFARVLISFSFEVFKV